MVKYFISTDKPNLHYIQVEVIFENLQKDKSLIQLPSWRPGRYELQNYAQNIRGFKVFNIEGAVLYSEKISKDCWEVKNNTDSTIIVTYEYFAHQLDAGASYVDDNQIYINPCNCLVYQLGFEFEECKLELKHIPNNYQIAGFHFQNNIAHFSDFHQLADSPFIASAELIHKEYTVEKTQFHIWMLGLVKPNWDVLLDHFQKFSEKQIQLFGEFPTKEYHFLCQFSNQKAHHGVEHLGSTVLYFGPGFKLMEIFTYVDFLGLASHELFHSWNVKSIRPIEMMPYDYTKENYTNLGYVTEGVTTYYGDLMLLRSGIYSIETYNLELSNFLHRHFHNNGRTYMTLAESSYDTWLDGYKPGVPDRKVNMYVKGMMVALVMDVEIRKLTNNDFSLDNVLQDLYHNYAKKGIGYSEMDYLSIINRITGVNFTEMFNNLVWGLTPLESVLNEALDYLGLKIELLNARKSMERNYGIKSKDESANRIIIGQIYPDSPSDVAGLSIGDEILALNSIDVDANSIDDIFDFFENEEIAVTFSRGKRMLTTKLILTKDKYFHHWFVFVNEKLSEVQKVNFAKWSN